VEKKKHGLDVYKHFESVSKQKQQKNLKYHVRLCASVVFWIRKVQKLEIKNSMSLWTSDIIMHCRDFCFVIESQHDGFEENTNAKHV